MSVTAVPLRPLDRGTVPKLWIGILLVLLLGAGLAWLGTSALQYTTTESGVRYRVMEEGRGDPITPEDLIRLEFEIRKADGSLLTPPGGAAEDATVDSVFPGLREVIGQMREGAIYQVFAPTQLALGITPPPNARVTADEVLEFRLHARSVLRGMAAMQQMQQMMGGGGPGGPGGPPMPPPGPGGQ